MAKKYSAEQAREETLEYFGGDELATSVFLNKYALQDKDGNYLETNPNMMHKRIAGELARIEAKYPNSMGEHEIFDLLKQTKKIRKSILKVNKLKR